MSLLAEHIETACTVDCLGVEGEILSSTGLTIEALGLPVPIGSLCAIAAGAGPASGFGIAIPAEVIGFKRDLTLLMPLDGPRVRGSSGRPAFHSADTRPVQASITRGRRIRQITARQTVPVGPALLGRVVDAMGAACDGGPPIPVDCFYPLHRDPPPPMARTPIDIPLSVGIRSINALATVGRGQRMGIFSGTGVGKSVLLGQMARHTSADVTVIAMVGERGRELRDFIRNDLGPDGLQRSVIVVSTSDQSPPLRSRAPFTATAIAEYFRDFGADVLLLMDSVTRFAHSARQIGLAAGEPPATKGYPPSVFAKLPRLLERSGRTETGSITGLYTVLVEGDDLTEPIADSVRGILDGHLWLARKLADRGQYPALSVLESISRLQPVLVDSAQLQAAQGIKRLLAVWEEIEDLVNLGAYAPGSNPEFDLAIQTRPAILAFLKQPMTEGVNLEESRAALFALWDQIQETESRLSKSKRTVAPPSASGPHAPQQPLEPARRKREVREVKGEPNIAIGTKV